MEFYTHLRPMIKTSLPSLAMIFKEYTTKFPSLTQIPDLD
jgi:hypothetical protein